MSAIRLVPTTINKQIPNNVGLIEKALFSGLIQNIDPRPCNPEGCLDSGTAIMLVKSASVHVQDTGACICLVLTTHVSF